MVKTERAVTIFTFCLVYLSAAGLCVDMKTRTKKQLKSSEEEHQVNLSSLRSAWKHTTCSQVKHTQQHLRDKITAKAEKKTMATNYRQTGAQLNQPPSDQAWGSIKAF